MLWLDLGEYRGPSRFHAFVMFCIARGRNRAVDRAYRSLMFASLQNIPQAKYIPYELDELLRPRPEIDVDAIIDHVAKKIGLAER
jgi:hypothetical protein